MTVESQSFDVRSTTYEAIREGIDWFVYHPDEGSYIGKVLSRPHRRDGPLIAYYRDALLGGMVETLGDVVDLIDRARSASGNGESVS